MVRKLFCMVFALGLLLGSVTAMAAQQTGSIGIMLEQEGSVTLYRVGEMGQETGCLLERYGGLELSFDDLLSPDLAAWLAQEAEGGITRESVEGLVTFGGLEQGIYLLVQTMDEPGQYPFSPFLVSIPWDGDQWDITASPKVSELLDQLPQTGQTAGFLVAFGLMVVSLAGMAGCLAWENRKAGRRP